MLRAYLTRTTNNNVPDTDFKSHWSSGMILGFADAVRLFGDSWAIGMLAQAVTATARNAVHSARDPVRPDVTDGAVMTVRSKYPGLFQPGPARRPSAGGRPPAISMPEGHSGPDPVESLSDDAETR